MDLNSKNKNFHFIENHAMKKKNQASTSIFLI